MQTNSLADIRQEPEVDTTPEALAERFGNRAKQLIREGRSPKTAARLAASFAAKALDITREVAH